MQYGFCAKYKNTHTHTQWTRNAFEFRMDFGGVVRGREGILTRQQAADCNRTRLEHDIKQKLMSHCHQTIYLHLFTTVSRFVFLDPHFVLLFSPKTFSFFNFFFVCLLINWTNWKKDERMNRMLKFAHVLWLSRTEHLNNRQQTNSEIVWRGRHNRRRSREPDLLKFFYCAEFSFNWRFLWHFLSAFFSYPALIHIVQQKIPNIRKISQNGAEQCSVQRRRIVYVVRFKLVGISGTWCTYPT